MNKKISKIKYYSRWYAQKQFSCGDNWVTVCISFKNLALSYIYPQNPHKKMPGLAEHTCNQVAGKVDIDRSLSTSRPRLGLPVEFQANERSSPKMENNNWVAPKFLLWLPDSFVHTQVHFPAPARIHTHTHIKH